MRSLIFRLMLSVTMALAGLTGLLVTRLRHPLVLDLLSRWRVPLPPDLEEPFTIWPLMKNQFEIDLVSALLAGMGLFLIIHYRRRLTPIIIKLEAMSVDRW
jgi:hypothetical protein